MKLPQEFLEAAHQEEVEEIMERGVKLGHFERKIGRRSVKSYPITPLGAAWVAAEAAEWSGWNLWLKMDLEDQHPPVAGLAMTDDKQAS